MLVYCGIIVMPDSWRESVRSYPKTTLVSFPSVGLFVVVLFRAAPAAYGEVPRLRVESGAAAAVAGLCHTATVTPDPSCIWDLHHSLQQSRILNPLSKARDWTPIFKDISWVLNLLSHNRNSLSVDLKLFCFLNFSTVGGSYRFGTIYKPIKIIYIFPGNYKFNSDLIQL